MVKIGKIMLHTDSKAEWAGEHGNEARPLIIVIFNFVLGKMPF
jgi:hypothetical protein